MGSSTAPTFANLFVCYIEECDIHATTAFTGHARCWLSYIDDIFLIWDGGKPDFLAFADYLNGIFPGKVFKSEIYAQSITYLDVMIKNVHSVLRFLQNRQAGTPCSITEACTPNTF